VRQLTDSSGAVTFAQAYAPYGSVATTSGSGATTYGFTNEYQSQGKIYLRARFYAPSIGRFLTRDTWNGDANSPMSFNKWGYVEGNPINRVDPTGLFSSLYATFKGDSFRTVDKIHIDEALVEVAAAYRRGYSQYLSYLDNYYRNLGCLPTSDLESIMSWLQRQQTPNDLMIFYRIHGGRILFNEDGQDVGWWATTQSKNQINIHKGGFLSNYTTYQALGGKILYASRYEDFLNGKSVKGLYFSHILIV